MGVSVGERFYWFGWFYWFCWFVGTVTASSLIGFIGLIGQGFTATNQLNESSQLNR
jgi:hypothetical protein